MDLCTEFDPPPIPPIRGRRAFDWYAWDRDTYEAGCPLGFGATEAEAIADLMTQIEERE